MKVLLLTKSNVAVLESSGSLRVNGVQNVCSWKLHANKVAQNCVSLLIGSKNMNLNRMRKIYYRVESYTYRLIGLKGGLKLQVVPVRQDVGEGWLVGAKPALTCLLC